MKLTLSQDPVISLFGIPKECFTLSQRDLLKFVRDCFIHNSKKLERTKCSPTEECLGIYGILTTMEFYPVIKKKGIMKFPGKWMELTNKKQDHP